MKWSSSKLWRAARAPSSPTETPASAYDPIAEMYHTLWANWYLPGALPALEPLFFERVPEGSRVLEIACGSGHVTGELVRRGYRVTGIDSSSGLIELARRDVPGADFQVLDARDMDFSEEFDAAISTYDSLNHMLTLEDLGRVFEGTFHALRPGGLFVFDMNLEQAYSLDLHQWNVGVREDRVGLFRGTYDYATKLAPTELIWFSRNEDGSWRQARTVVKERCYPQEEIVATLGEAGFVEVQAAGAVELGIVSEVGFGRIYVSARRQE